MHAIDRLAGQNMSALITFFGGDNIPVAIVNTDNPIGCQEYADIARDLTRFGAKPKGWTFLGQGMSRIVWLGPDNVAYKVVTCDSYKQRGSNANESEYLLYTALKDKLPVYIRLAKCFIWSNDVNAMEYIPGDAPDRYSNQLDALVKETQRIARNEGFDVFDLHGGNIRFDGTTLTLIDYAL